MRDTSEMLLALLTFTVISACVWVTVRVPECPKPNVLVNTTLGYVCVEVR